MLSRKLEFGKSLRSIWNDFRNDLCSGKRGLGALLVRVDSAIMRQQMQDTIALGCAMPSNDFSFEQQQRFCEEAG